ncbi:MAG: carbohydrate ABC transporter permease [Fimbriimonadaceae bacterium]|nr:MAG: carbohydrate ABC transporter permease [Fimbriimonadaceae bacterium]
MKSLIAKLGMVFFALVVVLPVAWVFASSLKTNQQIIDSPFTNPIPPHFENFGKAWVAQDLGSGFILSLVVTLLTLVFLIPIGSMMAYALTRYKFKGSGFILSVVTLGMLFPNLLAAVPLFIMMAKVGWDDTIFGLVLAYVAYSIPFTVFVLSGFFSALPEELAEAATIDGAGHWGLFLKVMMPLAKPGIWVVVIFNSIGLWNEYNLAKILLLRHKTLPVGLADLISQQQYAGEWGSLFAGAVLVMLPILTMYMILKDKVQQAMLAGAIK